MQKLSLTLLICFSVALFACHPDHSGQNNNTGPTDTTSSSASVLTKTALTTTEGTTTMTYLYDAQKRLAWYSNTSTKANYFEDTSKMIRDNNGIITQIVYYSDTSRKFPDPALDSVVYNVFYDATSSKYTYKLLQYKSFNVPFKDSTFYTYDAQGHIVTETTNYFDYTKTKAYQPSSKTDYTYDASGNMTALNAVYYKVDGVNDYPYQITYTYDPQGVNLLNLGNEAIVIGVQQNFSAHPPLTMVATYPLNPEYNRNTTYKYTYNTKYMPLKADVADSVTNIKGTLLFSYQ